MRLIDESQLSVSVYSMREKGFTRIIAIFIIIALGILSYYLLKVRASQGLAPSGVACTEEAKLCSDGTSVARQGPDCQFAACPGEKGSNTKRYSNNAFGVSFTFPASWSGPEEYVTDEALIATVGVDRVYLYGTSLENRVSTIMDAYEVTLKIDRITQSSKTWTNEYEEMRRLKNGESIATKRSLKTRIRELNIDGLSAIEILTTLPPEAQTSVVHTREIYLTDSKDRMIRIVGQPTNVTQVEGISYQDAYAKVENGYLKAFYDIVASMRIN